MAPRVAGIDLVAPLAYDGGHLMVSVSEMHRLPALREEPGLRVVPLAVSEVGQVRGRPWRQVRTELTFDIAPLDGTDS